MTSMTELRDRPNQPELYRECGLERAPETTALKMAVDGTLIVPQVLFVMNRAWGRRVANLRYSNGKVS
jgi:hypothetical protein